MARTFNKDVDSAIALAAQRYGLDPEWLRAIARAESSGNPKAQTGSFSGLFQLSPEEFKRLGGKGDIFDPKTNAMVGAGLLKSHMDNFAKKFGRTPELPELYMIHQQGWGGFQKHLENPDRPAWENMASTKEGENRGEAWARKAIVGNLTPEAKKKYGDEITSGDFLNVWKERMGQMLGKPKATEVAQAPAAPGTSYEATEVAEQPTAGSTPYAAPPFQAPTGREGPTQVAEAQGQNTLGQMLGRGLSTFGSSLQHRPAQIPGATPVAGMDPRMFQIAPMQRRQFG